MYSTILDRKKIVPNSVKYADDVVLALSSMERESTMIPKESLDEGIELCDYFVTLLRGEEDIGEKRGVFAYYEARDDMENLKESGIDIHKVQDIRESLKALKDDPNSRTKEELRNIQGFFIKVTMPMWQKRTEDFRVSKMKKGHIIRG